MVAFTLNARFRAIFGGILTASVLVSAPQALASSSNAADIAAPLRAAQEARTTAQGTGDAEFRGLFASWRSLDRSSGYIAPTASGTTTLTSLAPFGRKATVSIPSRMPVEGVRLSSDYGMRYHPVTGGRRAHRGVDLAGPTGTPIYATADAVVSKAEWFSSYGLYVALEHGADIQTRYGHMSRLNVFAGQQVRKGDVIGYIGSTGRSTGPHLHYEVRIAGQAVNPIPYMQADQFAQPVVTAQNNGGLVEVAAK